MFYAYLCEECNVEGESKRVFQSDLLRELGAEFSGGGCRVAQEGLCVAVHEGDGKHQGLLGLGGLHANKESE